MLHGNAEAKLAEETAKKTLTKKVQVGYGDQESKQREIGEKLSKPQISGGSLRSAGDAYQPHFPLSPVKR